MTRSHVEQRCRRSLRRSGFPVLRAGRGRSGSASDIFRPGLELPPGPVFRCGFARGRVWSSQTTGSAHLARPCRSRGSWGCDPAPLVVSFLGLLIGRARVSRAPQAGVSSFPGAVLPALSSGWVRPRPGSANSWAGDSTNTLVSRGVRPA